MLELPYATKKLNYNFVKSPLKYDISLFTIKVQRARAVSVDLLNYSLQLLLRQLTVQLLQDLLQTVGGNKTEHFP